MDADQRESRPSTPPQAVGRFKLLEPMARGGMGEVYLASSGDIEGAERPCVVKLVKREHIEDKSFLARFFDEARIQSQLQHPGIAQILEAATDPTGKPYVVMEYIEGRNLGDVRTRGSQLNVTLGWAEAVAIALSASEALAHVHERRDAAGKPLEIVHRDLSPQNVMVGYSGEVKLIDFGTARAENRRCQTIAGIVFAKPGYVAPEVANNTPGGIPADLYAIGIMLWELLAGRRFLTGDPATHLAAVAAGRRNPLPIAALVKAPPELDTVIARLTAPRLEDRYASARAGASALARVLEKAPSLANGERGMRARIAQLMGRLYPAEPAKSRSHVAALIAASRAAPPVPVRVPPSPRPALVDDASVLPGTRYRLIRELGRGAMGVVHEALHLDLGRRVALKVLPREHCEKPEFEARFRNEARAAARLRHPNLVVVHDFGVSADGQPFYAMELLEGEPLDRRIAREGQLDRRDALRLGVHLASALEAVHGAGLVHGDIKPGNVLTLPDGTAKLLDFGVVRQRNDGDPATTGSALSLCGTPEYMPPEQLANASVDARADVYALASLVCETLCGALPYAGDGPIALLEAKTSTFPAQPRAVLRRAHLDRKTQATLLSALHPDAKRRPQTVTELRVALELALGKASRSAARRRRATLTRFAAAAVVLTLAGLVLATRRAPVAPRGPLAHLLDWQARALAHLRPGAEGPSTASAAAAPQPARSAPPGGAPASPLPATPAATLAARTGASSALAGKPASPATLAPSPSLGESSAAPEPALDDQPTPEPDVSDEPPADEGPTTQQPADGETLRSALARAEEMAAKDKPIRCLGLYRKLGKVHPHNTEVLRGWSDAAVRTKGWGEALRVALRWAALDEGPEAHLHLAKIQRSAGQRYGALATLDRLLERYPEHPEARALRALFGERHLAMRQ